MASVPGLPGAGSLGAGDGLPHVNQQDQRRLHGPGDRRTHHRDGGVQRALRGRRMRRLDRLILSGPPVHPEPGRSRPWRSRRRLAVGYGDHDLFVVGLRGRSWACDRLAHQESRRRFAVVAVARLSPRSSPVSTCTNWDAARTASLGVTAQLLPFTVGGLICAASMGGAGTPAAGNQPVPRLAWGGSRAPL